MWITLWILWIFGWKHGSKNDIPIKLSTKAVEKVEKWYWISQWDVDKGRNVDRWGDAVRIIPINLHVSSDFISNESLVKQNKENEAEIKAGNVEVK